MKKSLLIVLAFIILIVSGCTILNDMWPMKANRASLNYADKDPNTPLLMTLGQAKELRSEVIHKHITTQLDLKYQVSLDKANHDAAMEINQNIEVAEAERQKMIGTIENPGWLLMALLGVTGIGSYVYGARQQRPEDYNESEMEIEVAKRVAVELAKK